MYLEQDMSCSGKDLNAVTNEVLSVILPELSLTDSIMFLKEFNCKLCKSIIRT